MCFLNSKYYVVRMSWQRSTCLHPKDGGIYHVSLSKLWQPRPVSEYLTLFCRHIWVKLGFVNSGSISLSVLLVPCIPRLFHLLSENKEKTCTPYSAREFLPFSSPLVLRRWNFKISSWISGTESKSPVRSFCVHRTHLMWLIPHSHYVSSNPKH